MTDITSEKNVPTSTQPTMPEASAFSVSSITDKMAEVTIHATEKPLSPEEKYEKDKKAYVEARFNPTDKKEKEILAAKLTIRKTIVKKPETEEEAKKHDEVIKAAQETDRKHIEEKRALLTEEFEADFELKLKEDEIVEAYAKEHFKPATKWKTQSQARYEAQIAQDRVDFIKANRGVVLHEALRDVIRKDLNNDSAVEKLDEEERVQAMMEKPVNRTYEAHFTASVAPAPKPLAKDLLGHAATPVHFSVRARQLWNNKQDANNPKSNPINFFFDDGAKRPFANTKEREMTITAFEENRASATSLVKTEKALKEGAQKPFTRLGLKRKP